MRALVLSGGGVKGAYQVGALQKWLAEDKIEYDILCGVSVGSINATYLAQFPAGCPEKSWEALRDLWLKVHQSNVKRSWWPWGVLAALWKQSVYDSRPLQRWLREGIDPARVVSSGRQLRVVAVSWSTGRAQVATEADPSIVTWTIASSSFPVMLLPVSHGGELWTDGGLRQVTPLGEAIRCGADEIDVVMCSNPNILEPIDAEEKAAFPGFVLRAIEIMSEEIMLGDLRTCGYLNDLAELRPEYRKVKLRLLMPEHKLVDNSLDFDPKAIRRMMAQGYDDAVHLGSVSTYQPIRTKGLKA